MAGRARERQDWMDTQDQLDQDSGARDRMAGESPAIYRPLGASVEEANLTMGPGRVFKTQNRKSVLRPVAIALTLIGIAILTYTDLRRSM